MILFHPAGPTTFRHFKLHTHMSSDLQGEAGTRELLAFGKKIGLKESWLQDRGQPKEHFDVFDGAIDRAHAAGAVEVSAADFIARVVRPKRQALVFTSSTTETP